MVSVEASCNKCGKKADVCSVSEEIAKRELTKAKWVLTPFNDCYCKECVTEDLLDEIDRDFIEVFQ